MMLFVVHCGFYDVSVGDGTYELHTNFFTVAENLEEAKHRVQALPDFKMKNMHVDGIQAIEKVEGYIIAPKYSDGKETLVRSWSYDDINFKE